MASFDKSILVILSRLSSLSVQGSSTISTRVRVGLPGGVVVWRPRTEISQSQPTALPTNTFRPPTSLTSLKPLQARGQQSESQHNNISTEAHCPTLVFPDISHCNVCVLYHWDTDTRVKSFFILCVIEDLLASTAVSVVSTVQEIYGPLF